MKAIVKTIILYSAGSWLLLTATAQSNQVWKGKQCAVVLTYDDALNVHLDNAIPLLDSLGIKATFYLTAYAPGCRERMADWTKAALTGHELGNHTLFHPCIGNTPGREWVKPEYDMSAYTVQRMVDETRMTNVLLQSLDGKTTRTFAYTCGDRLIGDSPFIKVMEKDFVAARTVLPQMQPISKIDLYNIACYPMEDKSGEEMIELVKKAMETKTLLVFLFHGVGGEHSLNVSLPAHRKLLQYLKQQESKIWIAPMLEVAEYVKQWQQQNHVGAATK